MKTPRIEETLRRYITEAYPKGQVLELLDQALTEAYQAGQKESNEDIRLLAEEIERLREDVEIARKAGRDEAVEMLRKAICSRVGVHTCRVGAVHVTEGEKERIIKALQDNK